MATAGWLIVVASIVNLLFIVSQALCHRAASLPIEVVTLGWGPRLFRFSMRSVEVDIRLFWLSASVQHKAVRLPFLRDSVVRIAPFVLMYGLVFATFGPARFIAWFMHAFNALPALLTPWSAAHDALWSGWGIGFATHPFEQCMRCIVGLIGLNFIARFLGVFHRWRAAVALSLAWGLYLFACVICLPF